MEDLRRKYAIAFSQLMCTPEFKDLRRISDEIWSEQQAQELASFADIKALGDPAELVHDHEKLAYWESLLRCNKEHEFEELAKELIEEIY